MDKRILITPARRTGQARLVHPRLAAALVKQGAYKVVDDTPAVQAEEAKPKRQAKAEKVEVVFTPDEPEVVETPEKSAAKDDEPETPKRRTYRRRDIKAEE